MEAQLRKEEDGREIEKENHFAVDRRRTERSGDALEKMTKMEGEKASPSVQMSSPEATIGIRVEDLWDIQEPQLSHAEKLNACFEGIQVSSFPKAAAAALVEINSDCNLAEAVQILAQHKLLSAPVINAAAPKNASWIDKYIGIVEFAGIVVWLLQQIDSQLGILGPTISGLYAGPQTSEAEESHDATTRTTTDGAKKVNGGPAVTAACGMTQVGRLGHLSPRSAAATSGNYFDTLTSSELYKATKVRDIAGSFRWAPFLALQKSNSMLTVLLLLSNYKMKSVPVVDPGEAKINNIITQSAVIHMLAECAGLHWFGNWGNKKLSDLGLPLMSPKHLIEVYEDEPVLQAFKMMRLKGIGGIPVVGRHGRKAVGNISIRDVQFLLIAPEIYKDYRSITAKDFLVTARRYREEHDEELPSHSIVTCKRDVTLKEAILTLDSKKIHRIYLVDDDGDLQGVITLRDIISRLVRETRGYFGDFFDGFSPNTRG